MKKTVLLMTVLALALAMIAGAACADGSSWICPTCGAQWPDSYSFCPNDQTARPVFDGEWIHRDMYGSGTALKPLPSESQRHQSYFGPNRNYPGAGAYKPYKVTSATALFREGDFVLVDLDYKTVGRRCLYFKSSALSNPNVEQVTLTPTTAVLTADVQPTFGPGYQYDGIDHDNKRIVLRQGTMVNVFFEADGWVCAEFGCQLGTIRGWIPMNMVSAY